MNNQGREFRDPFSVLLAHLFNHPTRHRAQVTTVRAKSDVHYPVLHMHRVLIPEQIACGEEVAPALRPRQRPLGSGSAHRLHEFPFPG